ncbi:hypothetical protein FIV00_03620 [Labrenzia sp. THAF82]|nr:hypothetical protein FIV00_03620 [Labrenzia sp. THAF82]
MAWAAFKNMARAAARDPVWAIVAIVLDIASVILLLTIAFRLITNPMINHFGNIAGETHGSARFATAKELAP